MPMPAISSPAIAGPMTRAELKAAEFRAMAFKRFSLPAKSATTAWRLGASNAITTPFNKAMSIICAVVIRPFCVNIARTKASIIKAHCVQIRIFFLFIRSAMTPAKRENKNTGIEPKNPTRPSRNAELVSSKTSQLWATV